jgi:hypothetical protein
VVGRLLTETAHAGDVVGFAEVSRMARSMLQVLEMIEYCKGILWPSGGVEFPQEGV